MSSARKRGRPKAVEKLAARPPVSVSRYQLWLRVVQVLEATIAHEFAWPFNQPVDPDKLNLPSYHIIVKHPMDLSTIKTKLFDGSYTSVAEFASDVRLVWQNCFLFNDKTSEVSEMCFELAQFFEWLYAHQVSHLVVDETIPSPNGRLGLVQGAELPNMSKRLPMIKDLRAPPERPANSTCCGVCEKSGKLLCCDGPCLRSFHLECIGLSKFPEEDKWFCQDCATQSHLCFECGERGSDRVDVHSCAHLSCGHFYHAACVLARATTKKKGRSSSSAQKPVFFCPLHACDKCGSAAHSYLLSQCLRCPIAYHSDCFPAPEDHIPGTPNTTLRVDYRFIVCPKHTGPLKQVSEDAGEAEKAFNEELPAVGGKSHEPYSLPTALKHLELVRPIAGESVWTESAKREFPSCWKPLPIYVKQQLLSKEARHIMQLGL